MANNTTLSFTATILVNGHPVIKLNEATDRDVLVPHPDSSLGQLNVSSALGILATPNGAWDEAREAGEVDFHLTGPTSPTVFYFRHSEEGYRLYIRGGNHAGQGVFKNKYGVPMIQPIEGSDPSPWQMHLAHSRQQVTLSELATDFAIIHLECASTKAKLATSIIGSGEGGFLITRKSVPATNLRLNILEREADWARR